MVEALFKFVAPQQINYFNGHRFRSRVFVDIGEPAEDNPSAMSDAEYDAPPKQSLIVTVSQEEAVCKSTWS